MKWIKRFFSNNWWLIIFPLFILLFLFIKKDRTKQITTVSFIAQKQLDSPNEIVPEKAFSTIKAPIVMGNHKEDRQIKGTGNGIYHLPDSPHYKRIKKVDRWFHSVEEAVAAGYRAPKK